MAELAVDEIVYQTWDCTIYDCQLWITSTIGRYTPTVKLVFQASIFRCYCWWFRNPKELPGMVIKPCKYWDKFPTDLNWCRIYSINSRTACQKGCIWTCSVRQESITELPSMWLRNSKGSFISLCQIITCYVLCDHLFSCLKCVPALLDGWVMWWDVDWPRAKGWGLLCRNRAGLHEFCIGWRHWSNCLRVGILFDASKVEDGVGFSPATGLTRYQKKTVRLPGIAFLPAPPWPFSQFFPHFPIYWRKI